MFNYREIFYGWWIVISSMVVLAVGAGIYWLGFGVFFLPLAVEFNSNRTVLSGAIALSQVEGGMLGPIGGYLVDRFGPRKIMFVGVPIMGMGFILMSMAHSLLTFYVVYLLLISVGMSIGIRVPGLVTPTNWFIRKRGIALGLATSGVGIGGILVPILGWLVIEMGWRSTSVISGLFILAVGLPCAAVMRHKPEQYGLLPDGRSSRRILAEDISDNTEMDSNTADHPVEKEASYTMMEAMKTPVFWLLSIVFGLRQLIIGAIGLHQVPFLIDIGINPQTAATVLGMTAITSIIGRLGFGWLADRIEKRYVMAATIILAGIGTLILANVTAWWHLIFFVFIYGVGWGGGATIMSVLRAEYFGRKAFGTISGMMDFVQMFGLVLGPIFAGFIFDTTNSYYIAFNTFALAAACAGGVMIFLKPPSDQSTDRVIA